MHLYPITEESRHVLDWNTCPVAGWVVPYSWVEYLRKGGGTRNPPHIGACVVLAEICFWHQPVAVLDAAGNMVELKKRFPGDEWQINYAAFAAKVQMSVQAVKKAISYLAKKGLVNRSLCQGRNASGAFVREVTVTPVFARIQEIAIPDRQ